MSEPVFSVRNVDVRIGQKLVLANCSVDIRSDVTCIMGLSGTGKSTLLKAMVGLQPVERGSIIFAGRDIVGLDADELNDVRREMAFVFQSGALFSSLSVYDNCALALRERDGLPETEIRERVLGSLAQVGLVGAEYRMSAELSGGMTKRVAIARALVLRPRVMLFDEPTTGADPIITVALMRQIRSITAGPLEASVIVTHDIEMIRRFSDRVIFLFEGAVIWEGTPNEMNETPNPVVRQFVDGSAVGPIPI